MLALNTNNHGDTVRHKTTYVLEKNGDPNGIRTRVTAVKGRCPRPG